MYRKEISKRDNGCWRARLITDDAKITIKYCETREEAVQAVEDFLAGKVCPVVEICRPDTDEVSSPTREAPHETT